MIKIKKVALFVGIAVLCGMVSYIFLIKKLRPIAPIQEGEINKPEAPSAPAPLKNYGVSRSLDELKRQAVAVINETLKGKNSAWRKIAINSLSGYRDGIAMEYLMELLGAENEELRVTGALGLARMGKVNGKEILLQEYRRWKEKGKSGISLETAGGMAAIGLDEGFEVLETIIKSNAWGPKITVAEMLGGIDHPRSRELLRELIKNDSPAIRVSAGMSLARLGEEDVKTLLRRYYDSEDTAIKWRSAIGLAYLRDETPRELFENGIRSTDPYEQIESAKGLLLLGHRSGGGIIEEALLSDDEYMRLYAAKALSEVK